MEQLPKLQECRAIHTTQHLNVLRRELEGSRLKPDVPWRIGKHEAKIYVDEVAVAVDEDVAVVSILDLEKIGDDGVTCSSG